MGGNPKYPRVRLRRLRSAPRLRITEEHASIAVFVVDDRGHHILPITSTSCACPHLRIALHCQRVDEPEHAAERSKPHAWEAPNEFGSSTPWLELHVRRYRRDDDRVNSSALYCVCSSSCRAAAVPGPNRPLPFRRYAVPRMPVRFADPCIISSPPSFPSRHSSGPQGHIPGDTGNLRSDAFAHFVILEKIKPNRQRERDSTQSSAE